MKSESEIRERLEELNETHQPGWHDVDDEHGDLATAINLLEWVLDESNGDGDE